MDTNLTNRVKNNFLSSHITVDQEWLLGCIDWVTSEHPGISPEDVYRKAHAQWLLTDLTECGDPCLPDSIFRQTNPFSLTGKYALQMNNIVDISESAYDQWRRLNDEKSDEPEPVEEFRTQTKKQSNKRRCLRLELTDGTRKVNALEYCAIPSLSTKLFPGCKILLTGPIQCANGVLLLIAANVKHLGGEVDDLLVPNAFENMLRKQLNMPLTPKPRMDYQEVPAAEEVQPRRNPPGPIVMAKFERKPPERSEIDQIANDDALMLLAMDEMEAQQGNGRPTTPELLEFQREDEDLFNDAVMLDENTTENSTVDDSLRDFVDDNLFEDDFMPPPPPRRIPTILDKDYKFRIRGVNLVTIDQLHGVLNEIAGKSFMLRGKFLKVTEKLIIQKDYWNMGILLEDQWSREHLQVRVLSEPLNKLTGRTAKELNEMHKFTKSRPEVKQEIHDILQMLKENIKNVDCFIRIEYAPDLPFPALVDFVDSAPVLNGILREKIRSENLAVYTASD